MTVVNLKIKQPDGRHLAFAVEYTTNGGRIVFNRSPIGAKNELRALRGSKWDAHGRQWSCVDCPRNRFQLAYLEGRKPYELFEQPVKAIYRGVYCDRLRGYQLDALNVFLTYRAQIYAAEMGLGKTLVGIAASEHLRVAPVWIGPARTRININREFSQWGAATPQFYSFASAHKLLEQPDTLPHLLIIDEAHEIKNPDTKRYEVVQRLADVIRKCHGNHAHVLLLSGTPSPKLPSEWWSLCEVACPGFLREGSQQQLTQRLAITEVVDYGAGPVNRVIGWDETEVAFMRDRLAGLVLSQFKSDHLPELPDKTYRRVNLKPSPDVAKLARAVVANCETVIEGLTKLRQLSDGFLYEHTPAGRVTHQIDCPKDQALIDSLEENEHVGRLLVFAAFRGSLDRVCAICTAQNWDVLRCDGAGFRFLGDLALDPLEVWHDDGRRRVVFVAQPESGGQSFTFTESQQAIFWSNSHKPHYRTQAEDRIHRPGMDVNKGALIVDLLHLQADYRALEIVKENRRLELLTMQDLL